MVTVHILAVFFFLINLDGCRPEMPNDYLNKAHLKKSILKDYDKFTSPIEISPFPVEVFLLILQYQMHSEEVLEVKGFLVLAWKDTRLSWNFTPGNFRILEFNLDDIWKPSPAIVSIVKSNVFKIQDLDINTAKSYVTSSYKGLVRLFYDFKVIISNACINDLTNWPYDLKNCSMSLGFPGNSGQNISISPRYGKLEFSYTIAGLFDNKDWKLYKLDSFKQEIFDGLSKEDVLTMYLYFRREGSLFSVLFLHPSLANERTWTTKKEIEDEWHSMPTKFPDHLKTALVNSFAFILVLFLYGLKLLNSLYKLNVYIIVGLILSLFWIDPTSPERMILIGFIMVLQCSFLLTMSIFVPNLGAKTPFVLLVNSLSCYLTIFLTAVTIIFKKMPSTTTFNPSWLPLLTTWVVKHPVVSYIFLLNMNQKMGAELIEEDEEGSLLVMSIKKTQKQWKILVQILDCLMFIIYIPILVYLSLVYIQYL